MEGKKTNKIMKIKNFKHGHNIGGNTNVNCVSFVGWWLVVGWMCFYLHTPISELTVYPSYTRPKGLAPLGTKIEIALEIPLKMNRTKQKVNQKIELIFS